MDARVSDLAGWRGVESPREGTLRVVHVNTSEGDGGAARAANRLHRGLTALDVDSRMLVRDRASDDERVQVPRARSSRLLARAAALGDALAQLAHPRRRPGPFSATWVPTRIAAELRSLAPDVVNLHWVGSGFVPPESLARLGRPLVWTLHDSYPFTGGCHVPGECARYTERCGACPALGSRTSLDLSRLTWLRKRRAWSSVALTVVTPSRWLADCAKRSSLFRGRRVEVIPNALDTAMFRPLDSRTARELLRLPPGDRIILFVAEGGAANPNKGFQLLADALKRMDWHRAEGVLLVVAGASSIPDAAACGVPVRCVGNVRDDLTLALLESAADVAVVPSIQENLPNTVLEAFACGTPVVAFRVGGMPDLIVDRVNGALVEPFDTGALADAIRWTIEDPARLRELSAAARSRAEGEYALPVQARRYAALYEELLRETSPR